MTVLHETVQVPRTVEDAFAYVSDFTTTIEWDATALDARKLTSGAIRVGTEFEVRCALPLGSVTLLYKVETLETNKLIELSGSCAFFNIRDTISFTPIEEGTQIEYRAVFDFKPFIKGIASRAQGGLEKMGRESVAGLGEALADNYALHEASKLSRAADRLVLPGVSLFSRLGYKIAQRSFNPLSASVRNKRFLITGASSGLGLVVAQELARRGAELTLVVRDHDKGKRTVAELQRESGNAAISYELADLSLMADVDALIARMIKRGKPLDVLINNAGAIFNPREETTEGVEKSHALLLLSPYRLTEGLKPLLSKAPSPRVINVVSGGMYSQKLQTEALVLPDTSAYSGSVAYARQKRALMVLTQEWSNEWAAEGIVVNAMHPGWADTPGVRSALPEFRKLTKHILRSPQEGADTIVWLAVATEAGEASGELFLDRAMHSPYLLNTTRETSEEREKLMQYLRAQLD